MKTPSRIIRIIPRIAIAVLMLAVIVLASLLLTRIQHGLSSRLPYTVGSVALSATGLPPGMQLKDFPVVDGSPVPTISLEVRQDSMDGWDVHAITTDFSFAPEHLGGTAVAGEGHVHLYVDDRLIIMLSPWFHLDALTPGTHTIRVGLFNNDHSVYTYGGSPIQAQRQVVVPDRTPMAEMK